MKNHLSIDLSIGAAGAGEALGISSSSIRVRWGRRQGGVSQINSF